MTSEHNERGKVEKKERNRAREKDDNRRRIEKGRGKAPIDRQRLKIPSSAI
jgi:hypothetical protein